MPTIPLPQKGPQLTSVVLTGQTVNATTGVLADGTSPVAVTLTTTIEGLELSYSPEHEEINAMNTQRRNMVLISDGAELNIEIYKVNNGINPNKLQDLYVAYDYFKAVWVEGTGGAAKTTTFYGVRGTLNDSLRGRGKQIASLQLLPIDGGAANVASVVA